MNEFAKEVLEGLSATPKKLSSKYFYNKKGDALFQQIMALDEYYLTTAEYAILDRYKHELLQLFGAKGRFNLIEFGAGDGYKTKVLLRHFLKSNTDFKYVPIDISENVLQILTAALAKELPELSVSGIKDDYFNALEGLRENTGRSVVLFLGSNIGNFTGNQAVQFLSRLYHSLKPDDLVTIGFDLKKDPDLILRAYNDTSGVTRRFNLNLLHRINEELGGNFDVANFRHYPIYNPATGTTSSYLISTEAQTVEVMNTSISFDAWETIHVEISQKYDLPMIGELAKASGFEIIHTFSDEKNYFLNSVWKRV